MDVTFSRTGSRRYGVFVERQGFPSVVMNPAPSYNADLPHDLIHFVVEEMLGLSRGIFGQLAAGGDAGTFRLAASSDASRQRSRDQRRSQERGERLAQDGSDQTAFSERAASICHHAWLARSTSAERRREAQQLIPYINKIRGACSAFELSLLSADMVQRVCDRLDELSAKWTGLEVGGGLQLRWSRM